MAAGRTFLSVEEAAMLALVLLFAVPHPSRRGLPRRQELEEMWNERNAVEIQEPAHLMLRTFRDAMAVAE
jgi:hypothetical protein